MSGRCLSYGDGITFWPMADAIRIAADIDEADTPDEARAKVEALAGGRAVAARLEAMVGLSDATFPIEEMFWGVRRLLETLAADQPLVLVINDLHWAEPTLLDLIEHLAEAIEGGGDDPLPRSRRAAGRARGLGRPSERDARSSWRRWARRPCARSSAGWPTPACPPRRWRRWSTRPTATRCSPSRWWR